MIDNAAVLATLTELFQTWGYTGTSLNRISAATKLGRGSLYHRFPGGKAQMLQEVMSGIEQRFAAAVLAPLQADDLAGMFAGLESFNDGGARPSLAAMVTLDAGRSAFLEPLQAHFALWRRELTASLIRQQVPRGHAAGLAELTVAAVEGSLVLTQAFGDASSYRRTVRSLQEQVNAALSAG